MDKLKSFFSGTGGAVEDGSGDNGAAADDERGIIAEALDASTLSWKTRVQGFAICFVLGVFISILATVMFSLTLNLATFGILYTLGNIVAISSTLFLMGPMNQVGRV